MKVRAIRSHFVDGRVVPVGEVYEIRESTARELIGAGRVTAEPEPPPAVSELAPASAPVPPSVRTKFKPKLSEAES